MGLALILIGVVLWLLLSPLLGLLCVIVGLVLLIAPAPYGFRR